MKAQILIQQITTLKGLTHSRLDYIQRRNMTDWSLTDDGITFIDKTNRLMEEKYQKEVQLEKLQAQKA